MWKVTPICNSSSGGSSGLEGTRHTCRAQICTGRIPIYIKKLIVFFFFRRNLGQSPPSCDYDEFLNFILPAWVSPSHVSVCYDKISQQKAAERERVDLPAIPAIVHPCGEVEAEAYGI